jgi:hypothetical protein
MIAAAMMQTSPQDEQITNQILGVVQSRADPALRKRTLEVFAYFKVSNAEGSSFIRGALTDSGPSIRAAGVEAAGKFGDGVAN